MKKRVLAVIAALTVLTAILAVIHLTTRVPDTKGAILVNGESLAIADFELHSVTGSIVNGKGEEKEIDAQGIPLADVCGGDFDTVTVTASDEYHAEISADEIQNAYLILCDDETMQLIVFGDENNKRDVKNVVRIDTE